MNSFSWLHLPNFFIIDYNNFWKIYCFNFFPFKSIGDQIWPCCKISQCQSRSIIWTNLVVLEYSMLHTKFQIHWPFGSREEDFESLLAYLSMAAILVMWHKPFVLSFILSSHEGSTWIWHGFNRPSVFWGKEVWKCWIWVSLDKCQWMTFTFDIHKGSCTNLVDCIYQLWYHRLK